MPYRIIVADPSPSAQKAAALALTEPEFSVFPFEDGTALLESVAELRPDALLVSLTLPGRDGYDVGRTLRSRKELAQVPLVGLKGAFEALDIDRNAPAEYDEVVLKPFDSDRLAALVRELIVRKTGPSTLPEEPPPPLRGAAGPARGPRPAGEEPPAGPAAGPPADDVKEWVRREMVGMEREIEKRVRARVVAELKEWMAGDGPASRPKE